MTNKPSFEIKNTTYKLSIQLNLNGFSFCIANSEGQIIVTENNFEAGVLLTEQELNIKLKNAFETKPELQAQFAIIEVVYTNELYCFIPKDYYDSNKKSLYFKYSIKTLITDYISEDELKSVPIVNLFIPYVNINNYLIERFEEFNYRHSSLLLVDYLLQKEALASEKKMYIYFHASNFNVVVTKGKQLLLCNTFNYQTSEDVLYYILFVMEQLTLSSDSTFVELLNSCSDEVFDLLHTYIRNIEKSTSKTDVLIHRLALNV